MFHEVDAELVASQLHRVFVSSISPSFIFLKQLNAQKIGSTHKVGLHYDLQYLFQIFFNLGEVHRNRAPYISNLFNSQLQPWLYRTWQNRRYMYAAYVSQWIKPSFHEWVPTSNIEILERFQLRALRMIVDASWYVPNTVIWRDLQTPTVKEEIHRYSSQYSARLSAHTNDLVVNLTEQPDSNRQLRRDQPNDLPTRFLV
jgi:hypothetical protein